VTVELPRTRAYRKGVLEAEGFPIAEVSDHLEHPDTIVWVDLCGPSVEQLHELAQELALHELAVEDAVGPHQRPKVDYYESHLFLSCHALVVDLDEVELHETEIDAFVHPRWIVTVRKDDTFRMERVTHRWDRSPDLAAHGVGFLLYALLDVVVDDYFDGVQAFDDYYDTISEAIFEGTPLDPTQQRQWFDVRRAMVRFHRIVVPMREVVSSLMRRDQRVVAEELYPYYQDVYDHTLRIGEATDTLRDLVATIVETNISLQEYRQNQIVKKVSSWAAIIAVPAFLTGYFGMNVPYPGSGETSGFLASTLLILLLSGALYWVFKRRDWL
jgi:magnesium transporter